MDLTRCPKIELHLHLDCSLSYRAVSTLSPGVSLREYESEYVGPAKCTNLAHFLTISPRSVRLMQSAESLRIAVEDVFSQLAQDGVIYAEIRFAPLLHLEKGLTPTRVVEAVDNATGNLTRATGVEARLILCTLRHFTAEQSMTTAQLVKTFQGSTVTALDLAGDEAGFPLDAHIEAYRLAREHGLNRTAHAGEASGAKSIRETLEKLQPSRIGHGVRCVEDPALMDHLRSSGVHLEVCPSANVQIVESIESWPQHPVDKLYRAGVRLNVNTDSRTLTPTTLTRDYEGMRNHFNWTADDFLRTNLMALDAAFTDAPTKDRLQQRLQNAYAS